MLNANDNLYIKSLEDSPNAVYLADMENYNLLYMNATAKKMVHSKYDNYENKKCYEVIMGRTKPCSFCNFKVLSKYDYIPNDISSKKANKDFLVKSKIVQLNNEKYYIGYISDITIQKNFEHRYNEEISKRSQYEKNMIANALMDVTNDVVLEYKKFSYSTSPLDDNVCIDTFANIICQSIPDKEEQKDFLMFFSQENLLSNYRANKNTVKFEYRRQKTNTEIDWVRTTINLASKPETGNIIAFAYTFDINEDKLAKIIMEKTISNNYDYLMCINYTENTSKMYYLGNDYREPIWFNTDNFYESVNNYLNKNYADDDLKDYLDKINIDCITMELENKPNYTVYYKVYEQDKLVHFKRGVYSYIDKVNNLIVFVQQDITETQRRDDEKNQALALALTAAEQANAAKSSFLSRMSHEIRTPMNAIIGMAAIAKQCLHDPDQVDDCITKIGISSRFLLALINDILDMSRIESGKFLLKFDKISFEDLITSINTICYTNAKNKNIDYDCIIDSDIESYYIGDTMKLQQVIVNILSNAVKFTPENGRVSLCIHQIKKNKNNAVLQFTISDTGCGIDSRFIPHIFDPFAQEESSTTSMYSGTGLGLAICKNIVDMMNGRIAVHSIKGVGSEFVIDVNLGLCDDVKLRNSNKITQDLSTLSALVVDDDVCICKHSSIILKEMGIQSDWVDSGLNAIAKIKEKLKNNKYYDLIMLDWKMPDMDGIETARQIRKIVQPDVTIIIMTAYDWASIEHDAKLAGVNLLVNKPVFKSTLVSVFERIYNEQKNTADKIDVDTFDFTGKNILLVEDHPLNVEVATKLLKIKGFNIDCAENGVRAIELFTTSKNGYYDAILMDIRMPIMDGLQAAKTIRHLNKADARTIPIIAMTANAFDDDMQKSKEAGMDAHLAKPIEPHELYKVLYDLINRRE